MPDVCLFFVLLFTIFFIVVTQKLVLQRSKYVTAKCTETLSPPPSIQYLLGGEKEVMFICRLNVKKITVITGNGLRRKTRKNVGKYLKFQLVIKSNIQKSLNCIL